MIASLRNAARAALRRLTAASAASSQYDARLASEVRRYEGVTNVHDLPPIFHYWSNRYLRPKLERFGFPSPDGFFASQIARAARAAAPRTVAVVSLGAGNCDTEVRLAQSLVSQGIANFHIECVDINAQMLERGTQLAASANVSGHIATLRQDVNRWQPGARYDVVMANQSLHHIVELEQLFDAVDAALAPQGVFVTSDMIGRNGHMRWPEAAAIVQEFWRELPPPYRMNQQLGRHEETFLDWDCSVAGFEGIRSQDILPLLVERFEFDLFIPFANVIDPFIDRSFGHHFNAEAEWDRGFIDRVHERDEQEIRAGNIKPTHVIATMCRGRPGAREYLDGLAPERCVRKP